MRSQSIHVNNEAMRGLKLLHAATEQEYIFHHELSGNPGFLFSPEMHAGRCLAAEAVGSSVSDLVFADEHNLGQPILDLRVVADCRQMCNG